MPEDSSDSAEAVDVLKDIRRWVKIIGLQEAKPVLQDALSSDDEEKERAKKITYHLTDGAHSISEIEERIQFSGYWIRSRYSEWTNMGLVDKDGSYYHIISLEEAGIEVPDIPDPVDDDSEDVSEDNAAESENELESEEPENVEPDNSENDSEVSENEDSDQERPLTEWED